MQAQLNIDTDTDILICLLTAIGLSPCGSSTVHIYTQTIVLCVWIRKLKSNT